MNKTVVHIFSCENCGGIFTEVVEPDDLRDWKGDKMKPQEYAEHIGRKTSIVSTHKCGEGVYGCAKLIGCELIE